MDLPAAFQQFSPMTGFDQLDQSNDGHVHIDAGFSFEDHMLELYEPFYPDTNPNNQGIMAAYPPPPLTSSPPQCDVSSQQLTALQSLQAQQQFQARQQNYYWQHQHQDQQVVPPRKIAGIRKKKKMEQLKTVYRVPADNILTVDKWAWRKYGQKPIKGSPYPRNYYRCSSSKGCTARKQVERSLTEPEVYVVTYTGDHFHPWPLHRNALAGISRSDHRSCGSHPHHDLTSVCHVAVSGSPAPLPPPAPSEEEEDREGEAMLIPNSKYVDEDMLRGMEELGKWKLTLNRSGSGSGLDGLGFY